MLYTYHYTSPVGGITIASNGTYLTGLWLDEQKYFPANLPLYDTAPSHLIFQQTKEWLDRYFKGEILYFTPPMQLTGTSFQLAVWEILKQIPYGKTVTYKDIAIKIARQQNRTTLPTQAVGNAVAHNPISIIIPCHRVIGSNHMLTGYAGGLERKRLLLNLEGVHTDLFSFPHTKNPL